MKKIIPTLLALLSAVALTAQTVAPAHWALTDALGRKAPEYGETSPAREGKMVAMFYWTWHEGRSNPGWRVGNITKILAAHPEAADDASHPAWDIGEGNWYYWDEPLLGYYQTTDKWVLRKHAEMLADAGVDAVFFDCTNGSYIWRDSYTALMETWSEALSDGVQVPKISFMFAFGPSPDSYRAMRNVYKDIYERGRFPELWFTWGGKPLIMGYPEAIPGNGDRTDREMRDFFTFRPGQPDYVDGPQDNRQWGWMEIWPQNGYVRKDDGGFEQAVAGVAQNTCLANGGHAYAFNAPGSFSRSYTGQHGFIDSLRPWLYGFNFREQWERASEIDPDLIFVTGWNEWTAGKHAGWPPTNPYEPFSFPDQYDWNRSRDVEPVRTWGCYADNYYCQLVEQVRRFKGIPEPPAPSPAKKIAAGAWNDWDDVGPYYAHYQGNTSRRDHPGYGETHYKNETGRNDITGAKVLRDRKYVWFYVETAEKITAPDPGSENWMLLFIDADRDKRTGWEGYDFVVNRHPDTGTGITSLERSSEKWAWEAVGEILLQTEGDRLAVRIPRRMLGIGKKDAVDIEFKWSDNMQDAGNVIDFYENGDCAPGGRFNFVYTAE